MSHSAAIVGDAEPMIWRRLDFQKAHGLGTTKFYEEVNAGKLEVVKVGRSTGVTREEARRYRASLSRIVPKASAA